MYLEAISDPCGRLENKMLDYLLHLVYNERYRIVKSRDLVKSMSNFSQNQIVASPAQPQLQALQEGLPS